MFSVEERDTIRQRLLDLAAADPMIVGAAMTGSQATGNEDRWSDIDLAFAVGGSLAAGMQRWTDRLYDDFGAIHHWDLPSGSAVYRVFLLPECLEVDIAFTPAPDFAPRGVNGQFEFVVGGLVISRLVATGFPCWWPRYRCLVSWSGRLLLCR